jgi:hypothetical protein
LVPQNFVRASPFAYLATQVIHAAEENTAWKEEALADTVAAFDRRRHRTQEMT